ncbi:MAG: TetR/AcrR family transcriptional regulator [bacterium]|nr:TetR/AcrR family transcriptional regulator [bacterium]
MTTNETTTRLLDAAQKLIQERGYNAFSYKDLAELVGIRTASIHYYYPAKTDLGHAVMDRYLARLELALTAIDRTARNEKAKLRAFIKLYRDTETCGAICLCGSLASDFGTMPPSIQKLVVAYLDRSEAWVVARIVSGVAAGEFAFAGRAAEAAALLLSSLQGGLLVARARTKPALELVQRAFFRVLDAA